MKTMDRCRPRVRASKSLNMAKKRKTSRRTAIVLAILALGGVAAVPFLRPTNSPPLPTRQQGSDLALRAVPLHLPAQASESPAIGLYDDEPADSVSGEGGKRGARLTGDLDHVGPPPDFNSNYPTLLEPVESWTNRPRASDVIPRKGAYFASASDTDLREGDSSRRHRIIDGDTLAKLARKYLGDSSRAGEIYFANRELLATPEVLPLGVEIAIPPR
jgi:phage tail protein X